MSAARARVLSGYRRLFRARKTLFAGDTQAMVESKRTIREEFSKYPVVQSQEQLDGLVLMMDEAADMLLHGIVRGNLNQKSGNYEVKIESRHVEGKDLPKIEPVTDKTVEQLTAQQQPPIVEKTKAN